MEKNSMIKTFKVSVCVSVHNTAALLPRCLDSLCNQTLKELEIVLVNNGSTDNSESIMHDYASLHPERTFVIVAQEDLGLAQGRQTGINNASGEYIAVLDADDYVDCTMYEKMYNCAIQHNCDIVEVQTLRENKIISSPYVGKHSAREVLLDYLSKGNMPSMMWMRLYKRNLFVKPVLPTIYTNNEDVFALPCLLFAADSIFFINEALHTYSTDNEQGVMHQLNTNPALIEKRFLNTQKALLVFKHFSEFVGANQLQRFESQYNKFISTKLISFLLTDFIGKTYLDKIEAVIAATDFNSQKEIEVFIKRNSRYSLNKIGLVKIFGIKIIHNLLIK